MDLGITGRTALVCASTGGLGYAVAAALAAEGVRVAITGRRGDVVEQRAAELPGAAGFVVDLADLTAVTGLLPRVEHVLGAVDILVLNSGGPPPGTAEALSDEDFTAAIDALARAQRQLVGAALPAMLARNWGRILAVGSSGVVEPLANLAASNVGRAALAAYLKTLSAEVASRGVTCNMLLPGRIDTDRVRLIDRARAEHTGSSAEEVAAASRATIPAGRYGTPQEFGQAAAFLCSAAAGYITGSQLRVDGGMARSY
ncbi:SDR family oxidoreductase [Pseudonocardia acidicola]|uniref:SDR family oxidoreductase n=1 Tax=Pseudonocardia acidicola TaxID=2724939 RepID=A0ABX1SEL8_9PSEU|nr:SDR family oxidoreductase [Pseudonocardia acidicola]NMH98689.1 SDR family oxidoreductase [Pseudonocardia acidicola]